MSPYTLRIQKVCSRLAPLLQGQRLGWHHVATATSSSHMPADHRRIVGWVGFINPASRSGDRTRGMLGWWGQPSLRSCPDTSASGRRARGFRHHYKGRAALASCRDPPARHPATPPPPPPPPPP